MVQLFPPISHIFNTLGSPQLLDTLNECLEYQNPLAIENTGRVLSDLGLKFIMTAVKQGIACCETRKIVTHGWPTWPTFDQQQKQEQPIAFAVVEPAVFPKFGEVLKKNKCEDLAEMMEQLNVNAAAAHGGLSEEHYLLASINKDLEDAMGSKFICNKCKKQLELDDICYCDDAKTKCHCNSRTCCTVTQEERGKSN
uniref:CXC domain-containing protein n=1 Tax=Globodera pallida TaxID=36090 RepID=A0A183BSD7_GLOPA